MIPFFDKMKHAIEMLGGKRDVAIMVVASIIFSMCVILPHWADRVFLRKSAW
jgi:hypothetical protein